MNKLCLRRRDSLNLLLGKLLRILNNFLLDPLRCWLLLGLINLLLSNDLRLNLLLNLRLDLLLNLWLDLLLNLSLLLNLRLLRLDNLLLNNLAVKGSRNCSPELYRSWSGLEIKHYFNKSMEFNRIKILDELDHSIEILLNYGVILIIAFYWTTQGSSF